MLVCTRMEIISLKRVKPKATASCLEFPFIPRECISGLIKIAQIEQPQQSQNEWVVGLGNHKIAVHDLMQYQSPWLTLWRESIRQKRGLYIQCTHISLMDIFTPYCSSCEEHMFIITAMNLAETEMN